MPTFDIDDVTQNTLKEELSTQLDLGSQETQISVDEAFFKKFTGDGFAEKYINTDENANITYSATRPYLLEDGSVRLQKTFFLPLVMNLPILEFLEQLLMLYQKMFIVKPLILIQK